jgi:hypothetical protein
VSLGSAWVTFGNYTIPETLGPIGAEYKVVGGSSQFELLPGSGQFIAVDEFTIDAYNLTHAELTIKVTFFFEFPSTGNLSVTVWARGKYSLPDLELFEDVLYLENMVTFDGSLKILGNNDREIKPKEYTKENETINITGLRLIYEKNYEGIYPRNESYYFLVRDEVGTQYLQRNTSGKMLFFRISMPLEAVKKTFTMIMLGIPVKNFVGDLPEFWLLVDNTPPPAPLTMSIRADSRIDQQILVDNDDTLYVSWSTVNDIGSGVAKYRIYTSYEPGDDSVPWVDSKTTQYVWVGTTAGVFTLLVWAEDFVGHAGPPIKRSIIIDKDPPFFSEFNIPENVWIKTLTPDITIWVKDDLSKGEESATMVWAESIEYSVSTNGTENFREWISADVLDNEYSILVKIKPTFEEGMDNWIKFRAKDVAGNGPVESKMYRLWIDVTEVAFSDVFPTQNVWHKLNDVIKKEVTATLTDSTSGVDVSQIWYRIAISKDEDGNPIWKTGIDQTGNWVGYSVRPSDKVNGDDSQILVHFKYTEFLEGEDNIIQFRTNDRAVNGRTEGWTVSPFYSLKINTKPSAVISSPADGEDFFVDELFTLDASGSTDIDVDRNNLDFQWYEGNRLLGEGKVLQNQRFSTLGDHYITLYVGDSGHDLDPKTGADTRANMTIVINIVEIVYPPTEDSDGDGMDDLFEHTYMLDPYDKSDAIIDYDKDGFSNLEEYLGTREDPGPFDPRDPQSYPKSIEDVPPKEKENAPFSVAMFVIVILLAVLITAVIVIISFIRMNRKEDREKREETEEEAMLVTPQLDIPTMPVMPMVDMSVPTLPAAGAAEGQESLPPAPEEMAQPADQPMPAMPDTGENPSGNAPVQ